MTILFVTKPMLIFRKVENEKYHLSLLRIYKNDNRNDNSNIILHVDKYESQNPICTLNKFGNCINIYEFCVNREKDDVQITYHFDNDNMCNKYKFIVPGIKNKLKMMYFSCNMICDEMKKNWINCNKRYCKGEINHFMLCGGDQIYADELLKEQFIADILNKDFTKIEVNNNVIEKIDEFFFNLYISYMTLDGYSDLIASVPRICILDDHEIFDGYGSYSDELLSSDIIKNIYEIGYKYYLLFQHNIIDTTNENKLKYDYFGNKGYNKIYLIDNTAIIAFDHRAERTKMSVYDDKTLIMITDKIERIKNKFDHYIFMVGVPFIYPHSNEIDKLILESVKNTITNDFLKKIGGTNQFNQFELTDDIVYDSWSYEGHMSQKEILINMMLSVSNNINTNIMILTGDSHQGGIAKYESNNKKIRQIMSSGMGSVVGNSIVTYAIESAVKLENKSIERGRNKEYIKLGENYFISDRNWCYINFYKNSPDFYAELCVETGKKYSFINDKFNQSSCSFFDIISNSLFCCCCK